MAGAWALFVWGYALAWFLVNDRLKLFTYWVLDETAPKIASTAKSEPSNEKAGPKKAAEANKPASGASMRVPAAKADDAEPGAESSAIQPAL